MSKYDIIVLGSGPGGYVTAIRASQLGFKTAIVEKENLGGVCLNWGCIPTKALLKSAQVFEYLQHAEDYGLAVGKADKDFSSVIKRSRNVADGMSKGVQFLMKKNKIDVLEGFGKLPEQPKSMIVVGSGAIGVEFAYFYKAMGTDVTIVEFLPNLVPLEDEEVSKQFERSFKKSGIKVMTSSSVESVDTSGKSVKAKVKTKKGEETLEADVVLSAVGIKTNIENIGLEELGIKTDKDKILVNDWYQTNVQGIYAIGDVVHGPALAHVASAEGITCVEKIKGLHVEPIDYGNIPGCTYASPEIASVGMTEKQAREAGYDLKVGKFPFSASGKAKAAGTPEGFVKVIFDAKYGEWLGCHMIGA